MNKLEQKEEVQKMEVSAVSFGEKLKKDTTITQMKNALPAHKKANVERLLRVALTEFKLNKGLQGCSHDSIIASMTQACQLGLDIGSASGQVYLIPFGEKCTIMLGYRGMIELAYRSGFIASIQPHTVYEKDHFEIEEGTEPRITHKRNLSESGPVKGYYIVAKLKKGGSVFKYMSIKDIDRVRDSHAKNSSIWKQHPEAMSLKTVMRSLFKWLPQSSEMLEAISSESYDENKGYDIDGDSSYRNTETGEVFGTKSHYVSSLIGPSKDEELAFDGGCSD